MVAARGSVYQKMVTGTFFSRHIRGSDGMHRAKNVPFTIFPEGGMVLTTPFWLNRLDYT